MADVSWIQPNFAAMPETDGHGDTCGPIAIADYLHVAQGLALTTATIDSLRTQYIAAGLMNVPGLPGMTMVQIGQALEKFHHVTPVKLVPWGQLSWNQFHTDLIAALMVRQYVIVETSKASALPGNQPGVNNHFIGVWGIQSDIGYYSANGDTLLALAKGQNGVAGPVWYDATDIANSAPGAYAILPAVQLPTPPPATIPFTINGVVQHISTGSLTYA